MSLRPKKHKSKQLETEEDEGQKYLKGYWKARQEYAEKQESAMKPRKIKSKVEKTRENEDKKPESERTSDNQVASSAKTTPAQPQQEPPDSKSISIHNAQHQRLPNSGRIGWHEESAILSGYMWSLMLYAAVGVIWIVDLWQIQSGAEWPISDFTPDLGLFLVIILLCIVHFPLTVYILYWQWDCYRTRDTDVKVSLDSDCFRNQTTIAFLILGFIFISLFGLKCVIEGELLLPVWLNPLMLASSILLLTIVCTIILHHRQ
ncbi:MAG: hypothetical protein ACOC3C_08250 [Candidatus Thorarchaeota archaeon]